MIRKIASLLVILGLMLGMMVVPAQAEEPPTVEDIEDSIIAGLAWLVSEQNPTDGSWGTSDKVARTGFAVLKLEDRAYDLGYDSPFDPEYEYSGNVTAGLEYIFSQAQSYTPGICWEKCQYHETYNTALAVMAIAASRSPDEVVSVGNAVVDGKTYKQVLDLVMDYFEATQNINGGWGYTQCGGELYKRSDNSITGWAVLALRYAEASLYGFECTIPETMKDNVDNWIDTIQCQTPGANFGGSGYESACNWVNLLKTGNLLFEMAFVGNNTSTDRVIDAIGYIQNHWDDANWDPGWKGPAWTGGPDNPHYQAMYCMMKGFQSLDIDTITVGGSPIDWFDEFATAILDTQILPDGYWPWDDWGDEMLTTAWALLTLEKVSPPPPVNVVVEVPECACDDDGYDVEVTYTVERIPSTGTVEVHKEGTLYDTIILTDFSGTESKLYNIASDTPGMHTWKAVIDVTTGAGAQAHAEDEASLPVCETPEVLNIPDQIAPFETFDLDDCLSYSGALPVSWAVSGVPVGWTVDIDAENVVTVTSPEGASEPAIITFTASVTCCNGVVCSDSDDAVFTPNRPPDCSEAYADPGCLWPPNHKFVDISVMGVTDPDGDPITITIVAITSDEATATDKGSGGANHAPDAYGVGTDTASVRAERSGNGDGRVYTISFMADDGRGGVCEGSVTVNVPHDQSDDTCSAIDSGQDYDATDIN